MIRCKRELSPKLLSQVAIHVHFTQVQKQVTHQPAAKARHITPCAWLGDLSIDTVSGDVVNDSELTATDALSAL